MNFKAVKQKFKNDFIRNLENLDSEIIYEALIKKLNVEKKSNTFYKNFLNYNRVIYVSIIIFIGFLTLFSINHNIFNYDDGNSDNIEEVTYYVNEPMLFLETDNDDMLKVYCGYRLENEKYVIKLFYTFHSNKNEMVNLIVNNLTTLESSSLDIPNNQTFTVLDLSFNDHDYVEFIIGEYKIKYEIHMEQLINELSVGTTQPTFSNQD